MIKTDIVIVGAGVIGLAIANRLSKEYRDIIVIEKNSSFGQETSSRNSEVIHAGLYYAPNSLKATLCVEGAPMLYAFCEDNSINFKKIGKIVVASNKEQEKDLYSVFQTAQKNGVDGLELIDSKQIKSIEPEVNGTLALYSPNTGIIDSHHLMKTLLKQAEENSTIIAYNSKLTKVTIEKKDSYELFLEPENEILSAKVVINCAGLFSDTVAGLFGIDIIESKYKLLYAKGNYCYYSGKTPVKRLVYPVPHSSLSGLGVHATLDLGGRLRFGPDVKYVDEINYLVESGITDNFYNSISQLIPCLEKEKFVADMAGIRPKLTGQNEAPRDFIINHECDKGLTGLINLVGIESPGLTSCLAISKEILGIVKELL